MTETMCAPVTKGLGSEHSAALDAAPVAARRLHRHRDRHQIACVKAGMQGHFSMVTVHTSQRQEPKSGRLLSRGFLCCARGDHDGWPCSCLSRRSQSCYGTLLRTCRKCMQGDVNS